MLFLSAVIDVAQLVGHTVNNDSAHLLGLHYLTATVLPDLQGVSDLINAIIQLRKNRGRKVK